MSAPSVPAGYHTLTPYLIVHDCAAALDFYARAFGGKERMRLDGPGEGKIMHAEIVIGDSVIMLADEFPDMGCVSPKTLGGNASFLHLYVEKVDDGFAQAVEAGAEIERPVQDQFYGDRSGTVKDPFGYQWTLSTRVEEVSQEETRARMKEMPNCSES